MTPKSSHVELAVLDGEVRIPEAWSLERADLATTIRDMAALARALTTRGGRAERLLAALETDPVSGLRERCMEVLLELFATDPAAQLALERARAGDDDWLRLLAELHAGGEADAVAAAFDRLPPDRRAVAADRMAQRGWSPGSGLLAARLAAAADAEALAFVRAIGALPATPEGLVALEGALERVDSEVQTAAIAALGERGGRSSVPALHRLVEEAEGAVARAARDAMAQIQARLGPADAGRVSLAPPPDQD